MEPWWEIRLMVPGRWVWVLCWMVPGMPWSWVRHRVFNCRTSRSSAGYAGPVRRQCRDLQPMRVYSSNGYGGYGLGLHNSGGLYFGIVGIDAVTAGTSITDTNFHHVAVTKSGTNVVFYEDGMAYRVAPYGSKFTFTTPAAIGARGDTPPGFGSFLGTIDEVSVYSRALTAIEVQSIYAIGSGGKCAVPVPPIITSEPTNQTVLAGGSASFMVLASGTAPLSYQWSLNGVSINWATNALLVLTNVQVSQAGNYSVLVTNLLGSALSSNALLTVQYPAIYHGSTHKCDGVGRFNCGFQCDGWGCCALELSMELERSQSRGRKQSHLESHECSIRAGGQLLGAGDEFVRFCSQLECGVDRGCAGIHCFPAGKRNSLLWSHCELCGDGGGDGTVELPVEPERVEHQRCD